MMETWVDSHVHYYSCFALHNFLQAARENLIQRRGGQGVAVLLLTETSEQRHPLAAIRRQTGNCGNGWSCADLPQDPDVSLCCWQGVPQLVLIPGRQLIASEGLEVLALATAESIPGSRPLATIVQDIGQAGGVATIPWGFGKWWFHRGQVLETLLQEAAASVPLLLGDSGGRPRRSRRSRLFLQAEATGIPVIAGSDPLPLPGQERRVGSYGSVLPGAIDLERPQLWLRQRLLRLNRSPQTFGQCRGTTSFLADQLRLRIAAR